MIITRWHFVKARHCSHLLLSAVLRPVLMRRCYRSISSDRTAFGSKPATCCGCRSNDGTDRRMDARPFHRPCSILIGPTARARAVSVSCSLSAVTGWLPGSAEWGFIASRRYGLYRPIYRLHAPGYARRRCYVRPMMLSTGNVR